MIKAIKGTKDIFPPEITTWEYLEKLITDVFTTFNYGQIRTPVFEETSLFARGIGEVTDIVGKEMYTFTDKGGTSITLKPEMTASVMRAVLQHSLHKKNLLNKLYYISPMFRQERPQAGRLRQFHQFGAEAIGSHNPVLDFEMILIPYYILTKIGLSEFTVKVNSIGSPKEREEYKKVLEEYLSPFYNELSEESKKRFHSNILRIFDSKDKNDILVMENAPKITDFISEEDKEHFETVLMHLNLANLEYEVDHTLVRGLDYYTHTTFEIVSNKIGAQSALCGGGRYNLLSTQLGGPPVPAVGFAAGIERIILAMNNENIEIENGDTPDIYIVVADKEYFNEAYSLSVLLRMQNYIVELDYLDRSVKAQMREANKLSAILTVIVDSKISEGEIIIKFMETGKQEVYEIDEFLNNVDKFIDDD